MTLTRADALAQLTAPGEPYELQDAKIHERPVRVFVNAPPTLRDLFADNVSDAESFVYEDERYTFQEMYDKAAALATVLQRDYGVEPGDRVAISMRNYPEWVMSFIAITSIGSVAVAMNALWEADEIRLGLEDSGAKVLLADAERLARLTQGGDVSAQIIAVRPDNPEHQGAEINSLLDTVADDAVMPAVDVQPDDNATIFYTSGSTGFPKGALSTHRNIITALMSWELDQTSMLLINNAEPPELPYQSATLLAVPLFHVTGSHAVFLMSYRAQRKMVSMYKWAPDLAAELIEREQISSFVAPAAMTGDLVQAALRTDRDLGTLLSVGGGGAPRAPEQVKEIDDTFDTALPSTGWGMSETNAIGTGIGGQDYLERPNSSGRASAVLELKIIDPDGRELPQGERGELLIRGTSVIQGYWRRPEANEESFTDGWLHTGDVAYLDEDGFLFIVDRIKDLIIRGGENIGCGEVEAALLEHPLVLEASVYAVPDERLGEEVGATVCLEGELDEATLRTFLGERLARFKVPRYLTLSADPLARTASGKIFKKGIREAAVARLT
ncbi:MAG: class I adenylate-forming enzyme family protein [Pseudomonadota bacterium]